MDEAEVDAALARLKEDELRAVAKGALSIVARLMQNRVEDNAFMDHMAQQFNKHGKRSNDAYEGIRLDAVALTERLQQPTN